MTATFGDLARLADEHLAAVTACLATPGSLLSETVVAAAREIGRVAATMSRCVIVPDSMDPGTDPLVRAAVTARRTLQQAAGRLLPPGAGPFSPPSPPLHPLPRHLAGLRLTLAAAHDLLATRSDPASGAPLAYPHWAGSVTSAPVTAALLAEQARWSGALAPAAARLARAGLATPPQVRSALDEAARHLAATQETLQAIAARRVMHPAYRDLLHAIPAGWPPPRRPAGGPEPAAMLCEGMMISAERIRTRAAGLASESPSSPRTSVTVWRWAAKAAAVAGDSCELILTTLHERSCQLPGTPAADTLPDAAAAMNAMWGGWLRASRVARPFVIDAFDAGCPPLEADISDLVLRAGRLAYANPAWTPARSQQAPPRAPAQLAPDPQAMATVVSAVHHTADALACLGAAALHALAGAATAHRLLIHASSLPQASSASERFAAAPPAHLSILVHAYRHAGKLSANAAATLDAAAVALDAPSRVLAAARATGSHWREPTSIRPIARSIVVRPALADPAWKLAFPFPPGSATPGPPGQEHLRPPDPPRQAPSPRAQRSRPA